MDRDCWFSRGCCCCWCCWLEYLSPLRFSQALTPSRATMKMAPYLIPDLRRPMMVLIGLLLFVKEKLLL